jgi:carbon-monoxide dehydrogenase large subunit
VRVHPTGLVTVYTGSHSHGQGHETTFAQLVADELGIPIEQVEIVHGDTGQIPFGMGTYGSRSASVGGTAIPMSLDKIKEKGKKIAAHLLEASPRTSSTRKRPVPGQGRAGQGGAVRRRRAHRVRAHNYPEGPRARARGDSFYDPSNFCFPFGAHACVVEVERETGDVKIAPLLAVDDVGNVINPMIVDGMVHGGIAQGVGQALWEGAVYDERVRPARDGSMMDYAMPKADMLPLYETDRTGDADAGESAGRSRARVRRDDRRHARRV